MKRALIICSPDGYANAVKPAKLNEFFRQHRYDVTVHATNYLSRLSEQGYRSMLPGLTISQLQLYCCEAIHFLVNKQRSKIIKKLGTSLVMQRMIKLRGEILADRLGPKSFDILICENHFDEAVVSSRVARTQILDLSVPFAEELFYGSDLTRRSYKSFNEYEIELYAQADYISFHWHTYTEFVKKNKYGGDNFLEIGYSTPVQERRAHYAIKPRIAFLGYLGGYWVNLPLLEQLSALYPIDVYGGPSPAGYKINYKGYAPSIDVLADYQFGLITITDDPLRQSSFSSKQLDYYAFGLPVLTPDWRTDTILDEAAINFNLDNFLALIEEYSDHRKWQQMSDAAISLTKRLTWQRAFRALEDLLEDKTHDMDEYRPNSPNA